MKIYRTENEFLKANVSMAIEGEVLNIEWQNLNNAEPSVGAASLNFSELKQKPAFADRTLWGLSEVTQTWIPVYAETLATKQPTDDYIKSLRTNFVAVLYVRLASDSLGDCVLRFNIADENTLDTNGLPISPNPFDSGFPGIQLGDPTFANGIMEMPVALLDSNGAPLSANATVYVDATAGAVLTPRVAVTNGAGVLKVLVTGLEGQSGKVKAGFKFYSGVAERNFTI